MPYFDDTYSAPLAIAHRGGALEAPENTMRAFENAVRLGYQYIETDVRMTKDGVLVIFHDQTVDRLTDGKGKLASLDWQEISKLRVDGEPILRLEETLKALPNVYWNLDPKESACVKPLAKIIAELDMTSKVCVGSFKGRRQKLIKKLLGPNVATSASPLQVLWIKFAPKFLSRFFLKPQKKFECLQVPPKFKKIKLVSKKFIQAAHNLGLKVHIWTIDDPKMMEELLDLGVDGIMTDSPTVMKEVFIHRKIWISGETSVDKKNF